MSRIEQALRRASISSGPHDVAATLETPVPSEPNAGVLARYPVESGENLPAPTPAKPLPAAQALLHRRAERNTKSGFPAALNGKLILNNAEPIAVEQYRRLAATLHELQAAHGTRTLMVASALPREGKTLTVTNLALTLSESYGRRVLLIDADLRRPSIHEIFRLPNGKGLGDGLRSDSTELAVLPVTPLLSVLPGGRPNSNPLAGLTSERMRKILEEAAGAFDWVLLDAPPVGIMPDAHLLAGLTDGVIFVIAAGTTPFSLIQRAVAEIGRECIVGTVLNRIDADQIPATSYYDHYYHPAD